MALPCRWKKDKAGLHYTGFERLPVEYSRTQMIMENKIEHVIRAETLFAGIRKPINSREELIPRIQEVTDECEDKILGPLTHIFRFDTPVDGYDSEIGYPVTTEVHSSNVKTHTLRKMHFLSLVHRGLIETIRNTNLIIHEEMKKAGLSPELELMEVYHKYNPENQDENVIETRVSFLPWPEVYKEQLCRVLGLELTTEIWQGGENITPFTLVDKRVEWVAETLERLKQHTNPEQQFDILSRVALVRPIEDVMNYKKIYEETGDVNKLFEAENEQLKTSPTGGFIDPWRFGNNVLHLSKVAFNRKAYDVAETPDEIRKAYCFCALIREAKAPKVDPIFCYRAAGWARQFWEPILDIEFKKCTITHSILKGDKFCAWDYDLNK
jgi:effector-binding domain-containing protein